MSEETEQPEVAAADPEAARRSARRLRIAAAALGTAALIALLLFGPVPVPVTIDGRASWVIRGTTVAALLRQGRLTATPGDLVSVSGRLVAEHGGGAPTVRVNGRVVRVGVALGWGARVGSFHGQDVTEESVTRTIEVPPPRRYRGSGPVESVEESGTPGSAEVVVGAVSGEEVSRRVISQGSPATVRREPAWSGSKKVALTFDDGPWNGSTDAILGELRAAGVRATFFMVGSSVNRRPAIAKRVVAAGMEIGNHTQSHRSLGRSSAKTIKSQIGRGARTIQRRLGVKVVWFRPPGGSWSWALKREIRKQHERFVLWTVDPRDWSRPGARKIALRVLDHVQPGSVILLHDGGGDRSQTVAALKLVIAGLKARGYSMVTLSGLRGLPEPPVPLGPFEKAFGLVAPVRAGAGAKAR